MSLTSQLATALAATTILALTSVASAGEHYSFPSPNGLLVAAAPATYFAVPGSVDATPAEVSLDMRHQSYAKDKEFTPIALAPAGAAFYAERFGGRSSRSAEADGFRFITQALSYSAFANYANDYYRLFAPGHAVGAWTDRVAGFVDSGYGGPVDGWTAAAYYLPRRAGRHRDSAPDLSLMPTLRAHPELQQDPTFKTK